MSELVELVSASILESLTLFGEPRPNVPSPLRRPRLYSEGSEVDYGGVAGRCREAAGGSDWDSDELGDLGAHYRSSVGGAADGSDSDSEDCGISRPDGECDEERSLDVGMACRLSDFESEPDDLAAAEHRCASSAPRPVLGPEDAPDEDVEEVSSDASAVGSVDALSSCSSPELSPVALDSPVEGAPSSQEPPSGLLAALSHLDAEGLDAAELSLLASPEPLSSGSAGLPVERAGSFRRLQAFPFGGRARNFRASFFSPRVGPGLLRWCRGPEAPSRLRELAAGLPPSKRSRMPSSWCA